MYSLPQAAIGKFFAFGAGAFAFGYGLKSLDALSYYFDDKCVRRGERSLWKSQNSVLLSGAYPERKKYANPCISLHFLMMPQACSTDVRG